MKKVSIVIPCYNAAAFIEETLLSILDQSEIIEIIIVDDGSNDNTKEILSKLNYPLISYIFQNNSGVSSARNKGLEHSNGEYVIFFDADDKMSAGFLSERVKELDVNDQVDFVCGEVQKFNNNELIPGYFRGSYGDIIKEILFFDPLVTTCPSNYLFRRSFLLKHNIRFNTMLASTADKLFLVNCAIHGRSNLAVGKGKLLYRVSDNSMSHLFTSILVEDNAIYYRLLFNSDLIPKKIMSESKFLGNMMLSGAFWKIGQRSRAISYAVKAFFNSPFLFIKKIVHSK